MSEIDGVNVEYLNDIEFPYEHFSIFYDIDNKDWIAVSEEGETFLEPVVIKSPTKEFQEINLFNQLDFTLEMMTNLEKMVEENI